MKAHFVEFFSPGTFMAESSTEPVAEWNTDKAMEMARKVKERYGATPYGFRFLTRQRGDNELDSKVVECSAMYYLGGKVETMEEIERRADPKEAILLSNMRGNKWKRVITNTNSWRWTQPLEDSDIVLDFTP